MTNAPNPDQEPQNSGQEPEARRSRRSRRRSRVIWMRAGLGVTAVVLLGGAAGIWWLLHFIDNGLVPLLEENISQTIDRPVDLGDVEGVSLSSLVFGRSELPPTATDLDRGTVERVEVQFNPLNVLFTRRLVLDITLVKADVFLDENAEGKWITIQIKESTEEGPIKTEVRQVRVTDSRLTLAPSVERKVAAGAPAPDPNQPPPLVTFQNIDARVNISDNNQRVAFTAAMQPTTGGTLQIDGESVPSLGNTSLTIRGDQIAAKTALDLTPTPISGRQGLLFANLGLEFRDNQLNALQGTARLEDVAVSIANLPSEVQQASAQLRFQGKQIVIEDGRATYGTIPATASGSVHLEDGFDLKVQLRSVSQQDLQKTLAVEFPVPVVGAFNADATITGSLEAPLISAVIVNSRPTRIDRILFEDLRAEVRFQNERLTIDEFAASPTVGGQATGRGQVTVGENGAIALQGQVRGLPGDAIARLYGANLQNVRIGPVDATVAVAGAINQPQTQIRWQAPSGTFPAQGEVAIANQRIQFRNTTVQVAGSILNASGEINAGRWQAEVQGNRIPLAQLTPQFPGVASGTVRASGSLEDVSPTTLRAEGDVVVQVAGGTIRADATLNQGRWQAEVSSQGVQLQAFSDRLTGDLSGSVQASGYLSNLTLAGVQATGRASVSQVPVLNRPMTATFRWTGDRLFLDQVVAQDVFASGVVVPQLTGPSAPAIASFNFNVNARNIDLAALPVDLPAPLSVQGLAGFNGQIAGTPNQFQVVGRARLDDFGISDIAFEPVLAGPLNYASGRGLDLNLTGQQDQIALRLDGQNRPIAFRVRQQEIVAEGQTQGDVLAATLANFPLQVLSLRPAADQGLGPVGGKLSGNFSLNLNTYAAAGNLVVTRPNLGHIRGDLFATTFRYTDNQLSLVDGEFRFGESRLLIAGNGQIGENPEFQARVVAERGRVQDVLRLMQWFELSDLARGIAPPTFGRASDVAVAPVGEPNNPLLDQLRRYAEILALQTIEATQERETERLPPLRELRGNFTGTADLAFSGPAGVTLDFDLRGSEWVWGDYRAEQVVATGELNNGVVTLLPLRFQTGDASVTLTGNLGGAQQSGQFQARNVPIEPVRDILRLPLDINGKINANALLEGSVGNPTVRGEVTLVNTTINQNAIEGATTQFSFNDARLNFIGRLVVSQAEQNQPVVVIGSIPQAFPFMTVQPDSDAISLSLKVEDEGLSVINLLNNQVAWKGGRGSVNLDVSGTLNAPIIEGNVRLQDATFAAIALPEPLTDVNADVQFNGRAIDVRQFQGQFQQGSVTAVGYLPVFDPQDVQPQPLGASGVALSTMPQPLRIDLNQVELNFPGLYRGKVEGRFEVTGTLLALQLGGQILLSNGRVELPSNPEPPVAEPVETAPNDITSPPQLANLRISLGDRLQITLDPILNFVVTGGLELNGPLANLRPSGLITVRQGRVNLFTTQFSLDRRFSNTVEFRPDRGLDPIINARLLTIVPEVTRAPIIETPVFAPAEISDPLATDFGILDTVRIQAEVTGPASQLFSNLQLSSSPSRSREEIISLLGGGFVDTLGRGDTTLAIANLAGSALLTGVQNFISNLLGLTDFRLFPTSVPTDAGATTLGLASELGFDITRSVSVSVLQILTVESPTQFNLRYRLNDQFLIRGFVDTNGGNGVLIEFNTRF